MYVCTVSQLFVFITNSIYMYVCISILYVCMYVLHCTLFACMYVCIARFSMYVCMYCSVLYVCMLPLVGLADLPLHFFVICLFCSQEASLFAFNLSFRLISLCALHSVHVPFSYRHAANTDNK